METMVPKLVAEDIPLLNSLLSDVFPGIQYTPAQMTRLREEVAKVRINSSTVLIRNPIGAEAKSVRLCVLCTLPICFVLHNC